MREDRLEYWARTISEQETKGLSVQAFCRERDVDAGSFYRWRRRLRGESGAVRFALIETKPVADCATPLELVFTSGERLRISKDTDAVTLQMALAAIRA